MVSGLDALKASVATFAGSCANKLRAQGSVASCVTVFIGSNPFREDLAQYWNGGSVRLQVPTCDTLEIAGAAMKILSGAIDDMNRRFGLKTVRLAVEDGEADHWKSKSEHRSPNYLTDINEILTVKC